MVHVDAYRLLDGIQDDPRAGDVLLGELDALDVATDLTDGVDV